MYFEDTQAVLLIILLVLLVVLYSGGFGLFDFQKIRGRVFAIATVVLFFAVAGLKISLYII